MAQRSRQALALRLCVDHGGEYRITAGLKKYACFLTLDPNTPHTELMLSEDNRKLTHTFWTINHGQHSLPVPVSCPSSLSAAG
ncbi:hypothetical protein QQF64_036312 [Cirrhinus molitorella]|uniref:SPRY-associated domain-containing protein n=1 Tax=Cirrhinus molitorella TaxID=172907 RepID=A0ABR3NI88_9TELE